MLHTYKYKLYKSTKNRKLEHLSNISRDITNHCIALQRRYYRMYGKFISKYRMQKHITNLRKSNVEWQMLLAQTVQILTHSVDNSYQRFFKKLSDRPPKFKRQDSRVSFDYTQAGYKLTGNKLIINNVGTFKFHKSRDFYKVKRIKIKQDSIGDWYLYVLTEPPNTTYKTGDAAIGIDFGIKTFLTLSDGTEISSPHFFKRDISKLKKVNSELSRKKKGSNNRLKTKTKLARIHKHIKNSRDDFNFKLSHELCKNNSFIAIEDLNIESMKVLWGRKVSDLSFSSFVCKLEHTAKKYDSIIQKVDRYYASSKTCSCGVINKELKLSDRVWTCNSCGTTHKRDLLAANNILTEGIRLYRTKHKTSSEAV